MRFGGGLVHGFVAAVAMVATAWPQQARGAVISLDSVIDWKQPFELTKSEVQERLALEIDQFSTEAGFHLLKREEVGDLKLFDGQFDLKSLRLRFTEERMTEIWFSFPEGTEAVRTFGTFVEKVQAVLQVRPVDSKVRFSSGETKVFPRFNLPSFAVLVVRYSGSISALITPRGQQSPESQPVAAQEPEAVLKADLDFLLTGAELWNWTPATLEDRYVPKADKAEDQSKPPQFEWMTVAKDRARFSRTMFTNVETKLTMFGGAVKVEEATLEFAGGKAARATILFYNRGDSGEMEPGQFDQLYRAVGKSVGQALKVAPRSQTVPGQSAVKVVGWLWESPAMVALLECNDTSGGKRPEFVRLKVSSPAQAGWTMGKLSVGVQRMGLSKNVTKAVNGDVYIAGMPMVDQGAKGYCVAASCQRLFEYMQIPCDQHEMAQLLNVDAERGADALHMQKSLAKVDSKFGVTFKALVNPEIFYGPNRRRKVSEREFFVLVREHIDKGVPLLWALQLGVYSEDPPLPSGGQMSGGHMRMIIGYNQSRNKLLFTDSWGAGHELKRMEMHEAYDATLGVYAMAPRGM